MSLNNMTNEWQAKMAVGAGTAIAGAFIGHLNTVEQWSRIAASWAAIAASLCVVVAFVMKLRKKKKDKTQNHEYND